MRGQTTVIDGGLGKELERLGAPFGQPEWSALALLEDPDQVLEAHENFVDAGAEVVTTNAYSLVPFHIGEERFEERGHELIELAALLARQAADEADHPVLVAGCLPPLFGSYLPDEFDPIRAPEILRPLIEAQAPHVDLWLAETISSIAEFDAVIDGLVEHVAAGGDELELWAAFTVKDELDTDPALRSGESIAQMIDSAASRCSALLLNCSSPEAIDRAIVELAAGLGPGGSVAFGAYANSLPQVEDGPANGVIHEVRAEITPAAYSETVGRWIDLGATIVGGCCGMDPYHIAALTRLRDGE